jgi:hypothetical protein
MVALEKWYRHHEKGRFGARSDERMLMFLPPRARLNFTISLELRLCSELISHETTIERGFPFSTVPR